MANRTRVLVACLLLSSVVRAWSSPQLYNVCNSAAPANGTVYVNADIWDVPRDDIVVTLFYSLDEQTTWQSAPMQLIGGPAYDSTYEASLTAPPAGTVCYYVRASNGTNYGTGGPYNSGNVWPVTDNWLAEYCPEVAGDTFNDPRGPYLDLTSAGFGYSGDHFYGRLTNNDNEWPYRAGILGPWFMYSVGFANADAPSDSWGYSMTYGNVLGIYTTGLYELNKYEESFERIGDIDAQTSGNRLIMRCLVSDLTARPHWGPWPSTLGFLSSTRGETRSANALLESWQHDSTFPCRFYINRTPRFVVGQNSPPVLSQGNVIPRNGAPGTSFWFSVRYRDADTNLPVVHAVVVDGDTFAMAGLGHAYWQNSIFELRRVWSDIGWHRFRFVFNDGMAWTETEEDSFFVTGTAVAEQPPAAAGELVASPNPFVGRVRFQLSRLGRALQIFDGSGRLVRRLLGLREGERILDWDGRDGDGNLLAGGVYFCREEGGPLRRLLLVKLAGR